MIGRTLGCALVGGCLVAGVALEAHHSLAGVYDMKKETELSGSVEKVQFVNPHGSLTIAVKNPDGSSTSWVMTLGSATAKPLEPESLLMGAPSPFGGLVHFVSGIFRSLYGSPTDCNIG